MNKLSIVLVFVVAVSGVGFPSTGLPNEISNIQFQNVTQTSVDVVWNTAHPSTSQVLLSMDAQYETHRQIPAIANTALVTSHRVTVDGLVPYNAATGDGQYYIYVASATAGGTAGASPAGTVRLSPGGSAGATAGGQLSTAPGPQDATGAHPLLSMRTLPTNLAGAPNTLAYTSGPTTVFTGHDAYFAVQLVLVSGPVGHLYIQNAGGYNNGTDGVVKITNMPSPTQAPITKIGVHYACRGNTAGLDSGEQWYDTASKHGFCWMGNNNKFHAVRLRVSADTTPGPRIVTLNLISNGKTVSVTYPFNVVQTPVGIKSVSKTPTAIPGLATWEAQMDILGHKWCTYRDSSDAAGSFEGFGWEQADWFYDGGRVFEQIDDYKANVLNRPNRAYWQHCSQGVLNPYAYYLAANDGHMQGWRIFPYGMTMNYWRTHNVVMLDAVNNLATVGTWSANPGYVDPMLMREMSYISNTWMANAQLGASVSPLLQQNIDKLIGMMIMAAEGTGSIGADAHPFMVGLAAETLSRWYSFSVAIGKPDYRVVPVMKAALDTLWATNWQQSGWMNYNRLELPVSTTDSSLLNNLNSQGYAWLWYMTGDETERQHAYALFSNAFHTASGFDWNGKEFSQEFEFSFDTVRLLQNNGVSYTDPASNSFEGYWPVTTPPIPTNVNCSPTCATGTIAADHATITWTTYVLASTQVAYGTTTAYGKQTPLSDPHGVLSHSATLTGLLPATTYHFIVKSVDMVANKSQSADVTFTTQ
jgi:hypothetical protein